MTFYELLDQVLALLQRHGRVSYRALQAQFALDEDRLALLKEELIDIQHRAQDHEGRMLVWIGAPPATPHTGAAPAPRPLAPAAHPTPAVAPPAAPPPSAAERRQLTVLFCDLADSTRLARQLDPEDLRTVVRAYQETAAAVVERYEGHIAQYLGDGLLVYFGYPQAHEDDAQRAVRTGLELLTAMQTLNTRLVQEQGVRLAVRIGIHTGLVVVGEMGSGGRHEHLALGDTPNLAARLQGLAEPDTVVLSDTTARLVQGYFVCQDRGVHALKGLDTPVRVAQVVGESATQSRLEVAAASGLTPLVGRETELTLLRERWAQARDGLGQMVLLSGEAGIGKSRLVRVLTEQVVTEGTPRLTLHCSPYHTNSAFYPVIDHLHRLLHWHRDMPPAARLATLEEAVQTARLPLEEAVPLLAALLSVPVPDRYPPLTLSPQRQKHKTQEALVAWLLAETTQHPVLAVWEDLHWADPSTLELLGLLLDQIPTARLLLVLTTRLEFVPPWAPRAALTQLTLTRLTHPQVEEMIRRVTGGKGLPAEVMRQIVAKTDGVPLFVEELTKAVLEAGGLREGKDGYTLTGPVLPLAIPATLQDALMARLDRLTAGKAVAQLGATLGRTFTSELLQAVSPLDELALWRGLVELVQAEVLYQRGMPPQATYTFKHALIQETAYQSLLKTSRQQYHQRIAQVLADRFPEVVETQPELLAHHYTAAGLSDQAIRYWQQAGQQARGRSAHLEAIAHLTKGLELLSSLPETPARPERELTLTIALGGSLIAMKGAGAPEVGQVYGHAWDLCQHMGETPQIFPALVGLLRFFITKGEFYSARELGEQLLRLARRGQDQAALIAAYRDLGRILFFLGELEPARLHFEQGIALYDMRQHRALISLYGQDLGTACLYYASWALWWLGYPDQARQRSHEARALAHDLSDPFTVTWALDCTMVLHQCLHELGTTEELAKAVLTLATEQQFAQAVAAGMILGGWAQALQGQAEAGLAELHHGLAAWRATGARLMVSYWLALLAEAYGQASQPEAGLRAVAEALEAVERTGERCYEAELHRLKGELLLQHAAPEVSHAETCFQQSLDIARRQQAKSLELRAAMSLSRLWQQQGKRQEARDLLAPVYGWFTEGLDTADLQEAKALLEAVA